MHSRIFFATGVALATGLALAGESRLAALSGGEFTGVDESELAYSLPGSLSGQQLECASCKATLLVPEPGNYKCP